ncbi:MAG: NAD(P)-dependent oxidoreductase [Planctomycetota bacterium]
MRRLWLFDVDGTLIHAHGLGRRALDLAFAARYGWAEATAGVDFAGGTDPWIVAQVFARRGLAPPELAELRAFLADYGRAVEEEARGPGARATVLPGVVALLEALAAREARGRKILLTGNCSAGARVKLALSGLSAHFACGAYGDELVQREDLLPLALERTLETYGERFQPEQAVVGDSLRDVDVARAHGAVAVAVATGWWSARRSRPPAPTSCWTTSRTSPGCSRSSGRPERVSSRAGGALVKVFVTRALPGDALARLEAHPGVERVEVSPHDRPLTAAELRQGLEGAQVAITQLVDRLDQDLLQAAPDLKLVCNYAVGVNNVDLEAARARGVVVCNTPDVLTEASADLTWALLLGVARRVVEGDRLVRSGGFTGWAPELLLGSAVAGKTLGVVGLGRIGSAVARRAQGFGMRVLYTSRSPKDVAWERVELEALLREADFVCLHPPLTPETQHLLDAERLALMKPSAYLINLSRGPVVDEAALVRALRAGELAGAALDVFEREPELEPGLAELPNVLLAPHLGSATVETRHAMADLAVANVEDFLAGRPPRTRVP